jgi:hypothetical protein
MAKFKTESTIELINLDSIELNIDRKKYGISGNEIIHILEGEFFYCNFVIDAKIIVKEKQLNEILKIQNTSIHKIAKSIIYIHSFSAENCKKLNDLKKKVQYLMTENIDNEEIEVFKLI